MQTLRRFGIYGALLAVLMALLIGCSSAPAPSPTGAPAPVKSAAPVSPTQAAAPVAPTQSAASGAYQGLLGAIPKDVLDGTAKMPQFSGQYVIGAEYPRTGSYGYLGEEAWRGAQMAAAVQNYKGGIDGKEIKLDAVDVPDTAAAVSAAEQFISQKGYKLLMGSYASDISKGASEVADRNEVIYWETNGTADELTTRGLKYFFRTNARTSALATGGMDLIKSSLAEKLNIPLQQLKIAVINEDGAYGTAASQTAEAYIKANGMNEVYHEAYSAKSVDLSSMILKLKAANPDVLVATGLGADVILFWKQARQLDFRPKAVVGVGAGWTARDFYKAVGSAADGVFSTDFPQYDLPESAAPGMADYVALYKKTYNEQPRAPLSLSAYEGASALWEVIRMAGGINNPDAIRKAAFQLDVPMGHTQMGWGVKFGAEGTPDAYTNILTHTNVMQWQPGGKFVTQWPKEAANGPMIDVPLPAWSEVK